MTMPLSLVHQHQSVIDEVKVTLDQSNPINDVLDKLDNPMEESEFIIYMMLKNNVPVILQVTDIPVDVSKIQKAKLSDETKEEAIKWKCQAAAQKVVWIHRKKFSEVTGLGDKVRDMMRKQSLTSISSDDLVYLEGGKIFPPSRKCETRLEIDGGKIFPPCHLTGFGIEIGRKEDIYFPSTILPNIFESYAKKSELCNTLNNYYKATLDFTKKCLAIVSENFFLHVAEVDHAKSEDKYERMINEM